MINTPTAGKSKMICPTEDAFLVFVSPSENRKKKNSANAREENSNFPAAIYVLRFGKFSAITVKSIFLRSDNSGKFMTRRYFNFISRSRQAKARKK